MLSNDVPKMTALATVGIDPERDWIPHDIQLFEQLRTMVGPLRLRHPAIGKAFAALIESNVFELPPQDHPFTKMLLYEMGRWFKDPRTGSFLLAIHDHDDASPLAIMLAFIEARRIASEVEQLRGAIRTKRRVQRVTKTDPTGGILETVSEEVE